MVLDDAGLKRLQSVCLDLVMEVDRICRLNNIEYTLEGGTLIGAVREHGFIKWDDDADISMTRDAYNKFRIACRKDLDTEKYFLQDYQTDPEYPWGYSKLRMNGTSLVQIGQEDLKFHDGIFIDIFIYDNVPDGYINRRLHFAACYCIRKCQYSVVGKKQAKYPALRVLYSVIDKIPNRWLFTWLEMMARETGKKKTELMRHYTFPYFRKECKYGLPSYCFNDYIDADFEGKKVRIMKEYDTFLTLKYGDYMTPPPAKDIKYYPISRIKFPEK